MYSFRKTRTLSSSSAIIIPILSIIYHLVKKLAMTRTDKFIRSEAVPKSDILEQPHLYSTYHQLPSLGKGEFTYLQTAILDEGYGGFGLLIRLVAHRAYMFFCPAG
jgi:hypothetical protein